MFDRSTPVMFRYNASLYVPFFWVDDYYITGAVASAANVTYAQLGSLYTIPQQLAHTRFMSSKSFYTIMFGHFVSQFLYSIQFFSFIDSYFSLVQWITCVKFGVEYWRCRNTSFHPSFVLIRSVGMKKFIRQIVIKRPSKSNEFATQEENRASCSNDVFLFFFLSCNVFPYICLIDFVIV